MRKYEIHFLIYRIYAFTFTNSAISQGTLFGIFMRPQKLTILYPFGLTQTQYQEYLSHLIQVTQETFLSKKIMRYTYGFVSNTGQGISKLSSNLSNKYQKTRFCEKAFI